jgi:hypothetical protein
VKGAPLLGAAVAGVCGKAPVRARGVELIACRGSCGWGLAVESYLDLLSLRSNGSSGKLQNKLQPQWSLKSKHTQKAKVLLLQLLDPE